MGTVLGAEGSAGTEMQLCSWHLVLLGEGQSIIQWMTGAQKKLKKGEEA